MSVTYVGEMTFDFGEKRHVRCVVKPLCEQDLPFTIRNARWELWNLWNTDEMEATGECEIDGHELDAYISPQERATYRLAFIYEVADETWVDNIKVKVG